VIRYAITDRSSLHAAETSLLQLAGRWASDGIDFVQLREKDMDAVALASLARKLIAALSPRTKLLINDRADVAIAAGAAGVHLTARPDELTPEQVRRVFSLAGAPAPIISVSCHTLEAATRARNSGAMMILFAPVFEKLVAGVPVVQGAGLEMLHRICEAATPVKVLALGGVTWTNAPECIAAGAAGIAGIRLFAPPTAPSPAE
jgi:thiamine-phosphate pyrophosphorylase